VKDTLCASSNHTHTMLRDARNCLTTIVQVHLH